MPIISEDTQYSCLPEREKEKENHIPHRHILEDIWDLEEGTQFFFCFSLKTSPFCQALLSYLPAHL